MSALRARVDYYLIDASWVLLEVLLEHASHID